MDWIKGSSTWGFNKKKVRCTRPNAFWLEVSFETNKGSLVASILYYFILGSPWLNPRHSYRSSSFTWGFRKGWYYGITILWVQTIPLNKFQSLKITYSSRKKVGHKENNPKIGKMVANIFSPGGIWICPKQMLEVPRYPWLFQWKSDESLDLFWRQPILEQPTYPRFSTIFPS